MAGDNKFIPTEGVVMVVKRLKVEDRRRCIGCMLCCQACARLLGDFSVYRSAVNVKTTGGMSGEFLITTCQACEEPGCAEACQFEALTPRNGGGVVFHKDKCTRCGKCADNCPIGAIRKDEEEFPIICKHCGYCTNYCPHQCIVLKEE